jgi:hypothetical protein
MVEPAGTLSWDAEGIAKALKITRNDVQEYFTDGRRVSFILERRLAYEFLHGRLAPSEGAGFDVYDTKGKKWEVRSITNTGVYFCPSYMVGKGRKFDEGGFLAKLREVEGYILGDALAFPSVPFWVLTSIQVRKWWDDGKLGKSSRVSHSKALRLIAELGQIHL